MTSFAFIAGLIPLVVATGPGAIGNRTIGSSALGGMLFGTLFGVIIVPGLYFIFGTMADGRQLIRDEDESPLSEHIGQKKKSRSSIVKKIIKKLRTNNSNDNRRAVITCCMQDTAGCCEDRE
jgi:HAE1 family hydrophobic/amphiphilic exporter-1